MSASIPIAEARIVGAMAQPRSKAAFSRAALIVEGADGFLRAQRYDSAGAVQGPALTADEVRGLVETGHAIEIPGRLPLAPGAALWLLRRGFPRREAALADLNASGCLGDGIAQGPEGAWICIVDEQLAAASALRDRWRDEAMAAARASGREGRWQQAESEAEAAFTVARALEPAVLAMLSLAHEKTGRAQRAQGLFEMGRRSRGDDFVAEMRAAREDLERALEVPSQQQWRSLIGALVAHEIGRVLLNRRISARLAALA